MNTNWAIKCGRCDNPLNLAGRLAGFDSLHRAGRCICETCGDKGWVTAIRLDAPSGGWDATSKACPDCAVTKWDRASAPTVRDERPPLASGVNPAREADPQESCQKSRRDGGSLDRIVGILSPRELCIAVGILSDINDLVRRLCSNEALDRVFYEELIQWFSVELPSAGTDKFAIVKPSQRIEDFCSAILASCGDRNLIERAARSKCADGLGLGGIQELPGEWRIEIHGDLISFPNVRDERPGTAGARGANQEGAQ